MKRYKKSLSALAISAFMLIGVITPLFTAFADDGSISISTPQEFADFASNCTLDTWSKGKNVVLLDNIDLSAMNTLSVPTFGGTFDGSGYTISGIALTNAGSNQGLFRYIQTGGTVKNLTVKGNVTPGGTKNNVGGVAANNAGIIQSCGFVGYVGGNTNVGGIVGFNAENGQILACSAEGTISGEKAAGGIVGRNIGTVIGSTSSCNVNTVAKDDSFNINDIDTDLGAVVDNLTIKSKEDEITLSGHSDTGGIAGYSDGIIQGCTNSGTVGYQHVGYNVGGIAGRQAGYLVSCTNMGAVYGRKDVGGIVGQAEPYIILNTSKDILGQIKRELDSLQGMVNGALTDADGASDKISTHLNDISRFCGSARDNSKVLADSTSDFIDTNIDSANDWGIILSNTVDKLVPVMSDMETAAESMTKAVDKAKEALDGIDVSMPDTAQTVEDMTDAIDDLRRASDSANSAASNASTALKRLNNAIIIDDEGEIEQAFADIATDIASYAEAKKESQEAISKIKTALDNAPADLQGKITNIKEIVTILDGMTASVGKSVTALNSIASNIAVIADNVKIDLDYLQRAADKLQLSIYDLQDATVYLSRGLNSLSVALDEAQTVLSNYADDASNQLSTALDKMSDAASNMSYASEKLGTSVSGIRQIVLDLSKEKPFELTKLGDDFHNASDDLFSSLKDIGNEMDGLRSTISAEGRTFTNNMRSINNQFNVIMRLVVSEFEDLGAVDRDENGDISDFIEDISDENIANTKQGKIADCINSGMVEADRNVGGIAGAMSIEYETDPEDDIPKPTTLNFTYQTKAVLQHCVNRGDIEGKKDCIGGVAGRMDIGTVTGCENYKSVKSSEGGYVGGVAGWSDSAIRSSYAKCDISGESNVGGIAGRGALVRACYSIVNVTGTESTGALIGAQIGTNKKVTQNFFVNNGLGGIDGVSYTGTAQPVTYDELAQMGNMPAEFIGFTVTFNADGQSVETMNVKYGELLRRIPTPDVPPKDGCYGTWPEFDTETVAGNIVVDAVYKPWITIIASEQKQGDLSIALAEGHFSDKAALRVSDAQIPAPIKALDGSNIPVWNIKLDSDDVADNDTVAIRLLGNGSRLKTTVMQYTDGKWKKVSAKKRGHYWQLDMHGKNGVYCVTYAAAGMSWYTITLIALGGVALLVLLAFLIIRRKRIRRRKRETVPEE